MEKENISELYPALACALTHDLRVCDECKKCKGKNFAEIRINLVNELSKYINEKETKND